jgi:hypothetical protein
MVERFPLNNPPIPPLIVSTGGNKANIHGLWLKNGVNNAINPPAKRLIV